MPTNRYAFCFVFNKDGKVLVLKRADFMRKRPSEWDLPGGTVEPGESETEGVVREVSEEAGIRISNPEMILSKGGHWKGEDHHFTYFRTDFDGSEIRLSEEHTDFEWHHPLVAAAMVAFTPHRLAFGSLPIK